MLLWVMERSGCGSLQHQGNRVDDVAEAKTSSSYVARVTWILIQTETRDEILN